MTRWLTELAGMARGLAAGVDRREWIILASAMAVAAALWSFAELADAVIEGGTHEFDTRILLALRTPADTADPIGPVWVEEAMRDITGLGGNLVLTIVTLVAAGFMLITGRTKAAGVFVTAVVLGLAVNSLMKLGFDRPRPDLVAHGAQVYTKSFPSSHATMSAIVYLTLGALVARTQPGRRVKVYIVLVALLLTMLVGISRVYLGVHWPTDVLAGWSVGAAWALLSLAALAWARRGQVTGAGGPDRP